MWLLFTLFPSALPSKSFRISARRSRARCFIICLLAIAREISKDCYGAYQSNLMRVYVKGRSVSYFIPSFLRMSFGRASLWRSTSLVLYCMNASDTYQIPL